MNKTPEPLEILRAAGWRMRSPFFFVRRRNPRKELLMCMRGTWRHYTGGECSRHVGETLAEAVDALGLSEPRPEALCVEYAPVMEAVR